ncbi:MAG: N-6 DNA methylase [Bacteroidales bacterium]|nr:N-6 DNA methylase [Bacteroidales bacterium]
MELTERTTDLIVRDMMVAAGLKPWAEKCPLVEVDEALKTASKNGKSNNGRPEYIAQVGKYLIVVEDKKDCKRQANYMTDKADTLLMDIPSVTNYAENGALHYAQHIACHTNFDKVFAFGCSGTEKDKLTIRPIYVTKTSYIIMPQVSNFEQFSERYIDNYFRTKVLGNKSEQQLELELIMRRAALLHEDLRNYGSLSEQDKPLIVSGILLALCNRDFDTDMLSDPRNNNSDGEIIFDAIQEHLKDLRHDLPTKYDLVLDQFTFIKNRPQLSSMHPALGKSPLKYFAEYIHSKVYAAICNNSPDDVLGRFYGEFLCYSGGDGKGLGIVLTPSHITQLMVDLLQIHTNDRVFDPCCGTGGFLISAMNAMLDETEEVTDTEYKKKQLATRIKKDGLHGIEMNDRMFSIATTNMVLRGDGKSNLICEDFLKIPAEELRKNNYTVGLMNPPYSQAKNKLTAHLSELTFINHLLDSLAEGARCAVIVPQSTMVGKTQSDAEIKKEILKHHTLEGVITLNTQTFYRVGTNPVIAIFTAHRKHPKVKRCKFIDFQNDGFSVATNVGLVDDGTFEQKKKKLLDCWFGYVDEKPSSSFMITTMVSAKDEWLHSFYYFNEEIPSEDEFEQTMADYLSFEFKMIVEGRGYLFKKDNK